LHNAEIKQVNRVEILSMIFFKKNFHSKSYFFECTYHVDLRGVTWQTFAGVLLLAILSVCITLQIHEPMSNWHTNTFTDGVVTQGAYENTP